MQEIMIENNTFMSKKPLFRVPGAYEAPDVRKTDLTLQGVLCDSFTVPQLGEEDLDIDWEDDSNS